MSDPHTFTIKLLQDGINPIWLIIISAAIGTFAGIIGQMLMAHLNHKRDLEKISYEAKCQLYTKIIETVKKYQNEITEAEYEYDQGYREDLIIDHEHGTYMHEQKSYELKHFITLNRILISKKVIIELESMTEKFYFNKVTNQSIEELAKELKEDLGIN
ncbi:MAG: hypothetical protein AB7E76_13985 [Deferribacterales bacterium]